jgi:hypothetical protein
MNDQRIQEIIKTIEEEEAEGEARSRFFRGSPPEGVFLTANRAALLKLASTFLRAAQEPIREDDCRSKPVELDSDLHQCRESKSDQWLGFVQRMETWPEPKEAIAERRRRAWRQDRVALLGCGIVAFVLLNILAVGVVAIWKMLFGH